MIMKRCGIAHGSCFLPESLSSRRATCGDFAARPAAGRFVSPSTSWRPHPCSHTKILPCCNNNIALDGETVCPPGARVREGGGRGDDEPMMMPKRRYPFCNYFCKRDQRPETRARESRDQRPERDQRDQRDQRQAREKAQERELSARPSRPELSGPAGPPGIVTWGFPANACPAEWLLDQARSGAFLDPCMHCSTTELTHRLRPPPKAATTSLPSSRPSLGCCACMT
jgi:hypothetical protein